MRVSYTGGGGVAPAAGLDFPAFALGGERTVNYESKGDST